jgi:thymidylate synthase ThyX
MIIAKIIEDSLSPHEVRLTTFSLVYPRFIHAEVMTHRVFSRNAASSRAIPIKKVMEQLEQNPAMPTYWGKNRKGMQATEELTGTARDEAIKEWLAARDSALKHARRLEELGVHKQTANRLLEPWMLMNTIITATDWDNFFNLRADASAQPEFHALAEAMLEQMNTCNPLEVGWDYWHLPYVTEEERNSTTVDVLAMYSVARCARVSYKTHEGKVDKDRDIERYKELLQSGHMSPFEHQATPSQFPDRKDARCGNFRGWVQYRKMLPNPYEKECKRLIKKARSSPKEGF